MRKFIPAITCLIISISLSGCGLMEDAFKAGVIFALIIIAVIALVVWLARIAGRSVAKKYDLTWEEDEITRENSAG